MSRTDIISDSFTILRNAARARKPQALLPYANILFKICAILKEEGYIADYKSLLSEGTPKIKVYLKYYKNKSYLTNIKRISTPSRRIYLGYKDIKPVLGGYGIGIFSTPQGVITDHQARKLQVGGEYIGEVW